MKAQICIASKGRPSANTFRLLNAVGLPYVVFVEPQDEPRYRFGDVHHDDVRVIGANDQGIAYARNAVLDAASGPIWMLDDDITSFYLNESGKMVKASPRVVLERAESIFREFKASVGSLEYQQFSWSAKKPVKMGGYCDVAVYLDAPRLRAAGVMYDPRVVLKEDRDLVMQAMSKGLVAMRSTWTAFACPKNGTNEGGCASLYAAAGKERASVEYLMKKWPGVVKAVVKPDGRFDAKIEWRLLARR